MRRARNGLPDGRDRRLKIPPKPLCLPEETVLRRSQPRKCARVRRFRDGARDFEI
jgi:hypothetical protein